MSAPLTSALLVGHVLSAVIGFGALFATGGYARATRAPAGAESSAVRRYFAPGRNLAGLVLFLVPVFGVALLAAGHWHDLSQPFPWVGLGAWLVASGVATGSAWPAQRRLQTLLAAGDADPQLVAAAARRCERAAGVAAVCFLVAVVFMVVQPR